MQRAFALGLLFALPASAATISITSDLPSYAVGDTITLTIIGDPQGGAANGVYGQIVYDATIADTLSAVQMPLTSNGAPWIVGATTIGDGYATVWNQIGGFEPQAADGPSISTIQLHAAYGGTLEIGWGTARGLELSFFGAEAPTLSVSIEGPAYVPPPPPEEPPPIIEPPPISEPPPIIEPTLPPSEPPPDYLPPPVDPGSVGASVPEPSAALIFGISLLVCSAAAKRRSGRHAR